MNNNVSRLSKVAPIALLTAALLTACNGSSDSSPAPSPEPDATREHDSRTFSAVEPTLTALSGATAYTGTYDGVHGPAAYAIEVPDNWSTGILVMYAHGYRGTGAELTVSPPARIRNHLISNGYAWAASSYSANYYDVRAGVEDTNALALAFPELTAAGNHGTPSKYYIVGHSMGGHITGPAIEAETAATANNVVQYSAAMPMCGVMDETFQFDYLLSFTTAAQHLAGLGPTSFPVENYQAVLPDIIAALWDTFPTWTNPAVVGVPTSQGEKLEGVVRNLSGGNRPIFAEGFRTPYQETVMGTGGGDGTINGILAKNLTGNTGVTYQFDSDSAESATEQAFNSSILRVSAEADANPQRTDGLRWLPVVNGEFSIPVLTMHTLGDLYVPFRHQQLYRQAATANGNGDLLVQRAIRSPGHCDFTIAEEVSAFAALANWEQNGVKPGGDDVLTASAVADPAYGCAYTNNGVVPGVEDSLAATRASLPACP